MQYWKGRGGQLAVKGTKGFISGRDTAKIEAALGKFYKKVEPDVLLTMMRAATNFMKRVDNVPFDTGNLRDSMGAFVLSKDGHEVYGFPGTEYARRIQHWRNPVTQQNEKGYGRTYRILANQSALYLKDNKGKRPNAQLAIFAAIPYALSLQTGAIGSHVGWFTKNAREFADIFAQNMALALKGTLVSIGNGGLGYARESITGL